MPRLGLWPDERLTRTRRAGRASGEADGRQTLDGSELRSSRARGKVTREAALSIRSTSLIYEHICFRRRIAANPISVDPRRASEAGSGICDAADGYESSSRSMYR